MPREIRFDGVRVRHESAKSYDELLTALLADIGDKPVPLNEFVTAADGWESYRERVQSYVGPSGFMLMGLIDHGAWIGNARLDRQCRHRPQGHARHPRQPADRNHDAASRRDGGPVRP